LPIRISKINIHPEVSTTNGSMDQPKRASEEQEPGTSIEGYLTRICMAILEKRLEGRTESERASSALRQTSVLLLQRLLPSSSVAMVGAELEGSLVKTLSSSVMASDLPLQGPLIDLILVVLKVQTAKREIIQKPRRRATSRETIKNISQLSLSTERSENERPPVEPPSLSSELLDCIILGLSSPKSQLLIEQWVKFLDECLLLYPPANFQTLIPLVDCFCRSIESVFEGVQSVFKDPHAAPASPRDPIHTLNLLFNGLEQALGRGHDQLRREEANNATLKTPEQVQGFFGNMVSGVFTSEGQKATSVPANNRLTVLLCFKDAVRVAFKLWSWGDTRPGRPLGDTTVSPSFNYFSIRLRNRTRRVLENLFTAEALECLESLVEFWQNADTTSVLDGSSTTLNLLHALEAARPKNTMPAMFNAIYSRTNPVVLDPSRKSSLTSELSDMDISVFLVAYTRSMDDDALDEVWADCMTFLRDILGNPLPHRQTLPILLEFVAILGQKIDNTNFGEQRKMRRDIGVSFHKVRDLANSSANDCRIYLYACLQQHSQSSR